MGAPRGPAATRRGLIGEAPLLYTECPVCGTTFGVGAAQLRTARGRVRCGRCLAVFDGLERLTDVPAAATPAADALAGAAAAPAGPRDRDVHGREVPMLDEGSPAPPPAARPAPAPAPAVETPTDDDPEAVPEILREDVARLRRRLRERRSSAALGVLAAALVAAAGLQVAWFHAPAVIDRYPQARSPVEWLCAHTGCPLPERRAPELVRMVSRDVRVHPRFEGALRISATVVNDAPYPQPYPRMRFTLFNVNGQTIASRVFAPHEYLAEDVDRAAPMRPRKPLQIALDLLAPDEVAVSFEFRFL